ncbi:extradiol dioxygenase [Longispora fulva]|uniref:Catechol 2,3-dioxygenase-like lactoylglutathione lyase family enzyme n=1 Tax=Longispora fulva TaxID=619741 RepID=A0A8J7GMH3_9ACTN|nr:VOC family protein [Longispora fulva]MBG6141041.1 catechol 2,3-dioxygenase-like lactoylglutathione lyase family enzyme [Longispora fulva]GIG60689.1 extradiol dioxygenase [Longispora fulva]
MYPRLLVNRFDECLSFYTESLGLPAARLVPGQYASFDIGDDTGLALLSRAALAGMVESAEPPAGTDRMMLVLRVDDVDARVEELAGHGATVVAPAADRPGWGIRSACLRDPDGNLVELQSY